MIRALALTLGALLVIGISGCGGDNDKTAMEGSGPGTPPANTALKPNMSAADYQKAMGKNTGPMMENKAYPKPGGS